VVCIRRNPVALDTLVLDEGSGVLTAEERIRFSSLSLFIVVSDASSSVVVVAVA
jgi:hypothetical protein